MNVYKHSAISPELQSGRDSAEGNVILFFHSRNLQVCKSKIFKWIIIYSTQYSQHGQRQQQMKQFMSELQLLCLLQMRKQPHNNEDIGETTL